MYDHYHLWCGDLCWCYHLPLPLVNHRPLVPRSTQHQTSACSIRTIIPTVPHPQHRTVVGRVERRSFCSSCCAGLDIDVEASPVSVVVVAGVLLMDVSCVQAREEDGFHLEERDCCSNEAARRCASPTVDGSNCAIDI